MKQRTGKLIRTFIDENPLSETYGQTRVEEIEQAEVCTNWQPQMLLLGSKDGINTYIDINIYSYTYNTEVEIPEGNTEPYLVEALSECEQIQYPGAIGNSGYAISTMVDLNPNSATYKQLSEQKSLSVNCEVPDTSVKASSVPSCLEKVYQPSGVRGNSGQIHVRIYDINPYSQTYDQVIQEFIMTDLETCKVPNTEPVYISTCSYCELNNYQNPTGYYIIIEKDINQFSNSYGTIRERKEYDPACLRGY